MSVKQVPGKSSLDSAGTLLSNQLKDRVICSKIKMPREILYTTTQCSQQAVEPQKKNAKLDTKLYKYMLFNVW